MNASRLPVLALAFLGRARHSTQRHFLTVHHPRETADSAQKLCVHIPPRFLPRDSHFLLVEKTVRAEQRDQESHRVIELRTEDFGFEELNPLGETGHVLVDAVLHREADEELVVLALNFEQLKESASRG